MVNSLNSICVNEQQEFLHRLYTKDDYFGYQDREKERVTRHKGIFSSVDDYNAAELANYF